MVRLPIPTATPIFPPQTITSNSNFLSFKHHCLCLLKLCSSIKHIYQLHAQLLVSGLQDDTFLITQLIKVSSLSSFKSLSYAKSLLDYSDNPVPFSWNILIRGYSYSDAPKNAILVFRRMRTEGIRPNNLTFPFLLKACAEFSAVNEGKQVHADVIKYGLDSDVYVNNNLINFYGSCKKIFEACRLFDEMPERTVVSWNAVITSCVGCLKLGVAIGYFMKLRNFGFEPDETTMVLMLEICAETGNLSLGRWIHRHVIERGLVLGYQLGTALVDMYAKSGSVAYAKLVFDRMKETNVWTWSAMILGLAQHGFAKEGLELFAKMIKSSSVRPNYVTFLGVLCACSHAGLVNDGFRYFHEMEYTYGIKPLMIHYGAMVDILGRAGRLEEAYNFITNMPFQPDPIVWRTLLSACSIHDVKDSIGLADNVRKRLLEQEPRRSGNFVMVANMYADAGMWENAAKVRRVMRAGGLKKKGGESYVELSGFIHRFFSGYNSPDGEEGMYQLLDGLNLHMQMVNLS